LETKKGSIPTTTPTGVTIPKLNIGETQKKTETKKHDRNLSNSSRGSIGRKERLRNALTGRSDGSEAGADQPKELPEEEMGDFLDLYDESDPFSRKLVAKQVKQVGDNNSFGSMENRMKDFNGSDGDIEPTENDFEND
jgi:hypothetical protein